MNKSYSKIRHIQEANKRLENRLLMEVEGDPIFTEDSYDKLGQELGVEIDGDLQNEAESCSLDEVGLGASLNLKPQAKELLTKVREKIKQLFNSGDREGLKSFLSEYKQKTEGQSGETNEQAETIAAVAAGTTIAGITAPLWAWIAIGAIVLILLIVAIVKLTSWIPKKKGKGCRRTVTYRVR